MTLRLAGAVATCAAVLALTFAGLAQAYAPADTATVHPGVQTYTDGGQCTSNFIFTSGTDTFIGQAAHCAGTGGSTATNGCEAGSLPLGTKVEIDGASRPGTLAYSSWLTMQAKGERDADTCQYNDFALVKIDPADLDRTNPSVPDFGGPTGLATTTTTGQKVLSYGNSSLRGGVTLLSPKYGKSLGAEASGWNHPVYTVTPGVPGDSGSGFFTATGKAFGTLSTLALAPLPASNGVSDLSRALSYASANSAISPTLVRGTEPFTGGPFAPLP